MIEHQAATEAHRGICGADDTTYYTPPAHDTDMVAIRNEYRWTAACQRAFLEELACTGSVMRSANHVGKSAKAAYGLRFRRDGAAFALGWDAAILVARAMFADMLMDRAIHGFEETSVREDSNTTRRGKYDNRLSKGMLDRLDKMAEAQALAGSRAAQVQLVVQDFENFLNLISKGGMGTEAALFFAARTDAQICGSADEKAAIARELAQISAAEARDAETAATAAEAEQTPEEAAQQMSVWYNDTDDCWMTDFPLADLDDACEVTETGHFGDHNYERTLTPDEETAHLGALDTINAPLRAAALKAHSAWFGMKVAA